MTPDVVIIEVSVPEVSIGGSFGTNFTEYTADAQPSDWTELWHTGATPTVRSSGIPAGGGAHALEVARLASGSERYVLAWDKVGVVSGDVEVLALFYHDPDSLFDRQTRLHLHTSGDDADESGYFVEFYGYYSVRIYRYESASSTELVETTDEPDHDQWLWCRFRREGNDLKVRFWGDGDAEPETWSLETTDATHTSGRVGVGYFDGNDTSAWYDRFAVATNGLTAQDPGSGGAQPIEIEADAVVVEAVLPEPTASTGAIEPDPVVVAVVIPDATISLSPLVEPDALVVATVLPDPEVLIAPLLEPDPVVVSVVIPSSSVELQIAPGAIVVEAEILSPTILVENWVQFGNIIRSIDPGDWPGDATFHFEAVIETTNGATTARARLYDVTEDQPVSGSEVTTTSTDPDRVRSSALTLADADREYRAEIGAYVGQDDVKCYAADVIAVVPSS